MTAQSPDARLLRALRTSPENLPPLPDLFERIANLRAAGYQIDEPAPSEFRLISAPAALIADDILAGLPEDAVIGREVIVFQQTASTNDLAARAGYAGTPEGLVIFAESQTAGRGRLGRKWNSPPGLGLLLSVLLRPIIQMERWPELTFCAALAVARTVEELTGAETTIKWPNDVHVGGRKIAGILLEAHHRSAPGFLVMGIGLNVLHTSSDFPPELREQVTSLQMQKGRPVDRRTAALRLLQFLNFLYGNWPDNLAEIETNCRLRGCQRTDLPPISTV